eukprot:10524320-Prorocentrum_lima.AAC.1
MGSAVRGVLGAPVPVGARRGCRVGGEAQGFLTALGQWGSQKRVGAASSSVVPVCDRKEKKRLTSSKREFSVVDHIDEEEQCS